MVTIHTLKKKDLLEFYNSDFYRKLMHVPFTPFRLWSYLENPFSAQEDFVLYFIVIDNQIVSYRIVLHDLVYSTEKIIWSSGNWTHPDYRRKGFSELLLNKIEKDYPHQLMVLTRTPGSAKLYQNREKYYFIHDIKSTEFYLSFSFLEKKFPTKISKVLNWFYHFITPTKNEKFTFQQSSLDQKTEAFLQEKSKNELFPLSTKKLQWIFQFPWLSTNPSDEIHQKFDFSFIDPTFHLAAFELRENDELTAFVVRAIRQKTYFLHYIYYNSDEQANEIVDNIIAEIEKEKLHSVVIRNPLIEFLLTRKLRVILKRPYKNFLFIDQKLIEKHPDLLHRNRQHGIGEIIFT
ncbi:Uncharacterised protein [Weeksella virosa]|uniref:GNAT family N-acetyltransferase n=1 Tax=Weeksella virosa TaxID=1014 RepID=UPI000DFDC319|nr:hypothetical protein [Weeksella virosa]SUP54191.1 Uncharacterised protein [Weeksella virosa]